MVAGYNICIFTFLLQLLQLIHHSSSAKFLLSDHRVGILSSDLSDPDNKIKL